MTTATTDELAVRHVIEDWAAAVRRKDFPAILLHHARDMWMFDVPPPLQSKGLDEYRGTWDLFFTWAGEPVTFDIVEMRVFAGRDVAFAAALMRCSSTETDGRRISLDFRLTVGLQKVGEQWTIVHEHHSIPSTS